MIKINLLIEKKAKKKKETPIQSPAKKFLTSVLAIAVFTLLIMLGVTYYVNSSNEQMKKQIEANKASISQLQKNIQDVKKYETLNASITQKRDLIETLRKNQAVPVKILDEVSSVLPEGVWLLSLLSKGGIVTIEGYAFTNLDIVSYIDNLKKSAIIAEATLEESKYEEISKIQVYKFKLNFKIKG